MPPAPVNSASATHTSVSTHRAGVGALALGAIGIVFGDIGTSPLYTLKEVFSGPHPISVLPESVLGILSLIFWSLIVVVSIKYVVFIMRADNQGEGGIMALIALVQSATREGTALRWILIVLGIFGAALFYGDGMITPAISVLSAVEGLEVAAPQLHPLIVPVAVGILIALFAIQRSGTARVGRLFGPVMSLWFITLAILGITQIVHAPQVLQAVNPLYAIHFFTHHGSQAFLALGAVVLAVTGAEALYADMGHFGKFPIRLAWFFFVLPALTLNYFGQGALLLTNPAAASNPFFFLVDGPWVLPLVALSTVATIVASQAVISGAFSVTRQAIQLGYLPRMKIVHTSEREKGQVYIPFVNWALLLGVLALVLGFQSSTHLAAAYGVAVTATMTIDTILGFAVVVLLWRWSKTIAVMGLALFLTSDLAYLAANSVKLAHGGWFPVLVATAIFVLLATWKRGRMIVRYHLQTDTVELEPFLQQLVKSQPRRVAGTAVFLTADPHRVPNAFSHNLAHNKIVHEKVFFLTVVTEERPYVSEKERLSIDMLGADFFRIVVHYGFKDEPDIPKALKLSASYGFSFDLQDTSFFFSRETIIPTLRPGMALWRERLFAAMSRNATSAMDFLRIPTNRVVELGSQIEI